MRGWIMSAGATSYAEDRVFYRVPTPGKHKRAGYTKNKSRGETKQRRKLARESRKRNR